MHTQNIHYTNARSARTQSRLLRAYDENENERVEHEMSALNIVFCISFAFSLPLSPTVVARLLCGRTTKYGL